MSLFNPFGWIDHSANGVLNALVPASLSAEVPSMQATGR
jgi:hypothetical protein